MAKLDTRRCRRLEWTYNGIGVLGIWGSVILGLLLSLWRPMRTWMFAETSSPSQKIRAASRRRVLTVTCTPEQRQA